LRRAPFSGSGAAFAVGRAKRNNSKADDYVPKPLALPDLRVLAREYLQERVWNDAESHSNTIAIRIRHVLDGHSSEKVWKLKLTHGVAKEVRT